MTVDKLQQKIEANLHTRGKDIHVEAIDADLYAAIDALADKLDRQVLKHKEKREERRHGAAAAKHETAETEAKAPPPPAARPR